MRKNPARVSPTAHYTSYVWYRNDMSHEAFATGAGRGMFWALEPFNRLSALLDGGLSLECFLLQRHLIIDDRLRAHIRAGRVGQVLEVACGLSPRGYRFCQEFPELRYLEADLPDMARTKRKRLDDAGLRRDRHDVVSVNALVREGPDCIAEVTQGILDPGVGTAIITEGLVNYFDAESCGIMWRNFGDLLSDNAGGVYLSDIHLTTHAPKHAIAKLFRAGLGAFSGGQTHYGFVDEDDATSALRGCGFGAVSFHSARDYDGRLGVPQTRRPDVQRVLEAVVEAPSAPVAQRAAAMP